MGCKSSDKLKPKPKHKKGLWSPEEDQRLRNYVLKHGHGCWSSVPINAGLQRDGKSCRLRWINYLRPGLKRGMFSVQEEEIIMTVHRVLGNKWSQIAHHLPGRTDNEIKNYWHSYLKKRTVKVEKMETQNKTSSLDEMETFSPSPENPTSRIQSYASLENMENSQTETHIFELPKDGTRSCLSKILFAEWLTRDNLYGSSFANSDEKTVFKDVDHNTAFFQDSFLQDILLNEGTNIGGELHDAGLSNGSNTNDIFKVEDQSLGNGFADYISEDDICSDFNMSNDVLYM